MKGSALGFDQRAETTMLRTTDHGLRTTDYGPRTTTDYGLRTTDYGLRTTDYGPRTTDHGLLLYIDFFAVPSGPRRHNRWMQVPELCLVCNRFDRRHQIYFGQVLRPDSLDLG